MSRELKLVEDIKHQDDFVDVDKIRIDPSLVKGRAIISDEDAYDLCRGIAKTKFRGAKPEELEEHIQNGYLGYLGAKHRFDPSRDVSFVTFIYRRIYGEMVDAIRRECGRKGQKILVSIETEEGGETERAVTTEDNKDLNLCFEDLNLILTKDQGKLLSLYTKGFSQKDIAVKMNISEVLVSYRIKAIFLVIRGFFDMDSKEHQILTQMRKDFLRGLSHKEIARRSKYPESSISEVRASLEVGERNLKFDSIKKAA